MEVEQDIERLRAVGSALAESAVSAGLAAPVPSCPEWTVRDLLAHVGMVHRWAATVVGEHRDGPTAASTEHPDDALVDWYRDGHETLVKMLEAAPADLQCWTFLPSPSPLKFWCRRQLHETAIHRVDAGLANGETVAYGGDLAADGVDEIITRFLPRPVSKLHLPVATSMSVQATDAGRTWWVEIGPGVPVGVEITDDDAQPTADCAVRGSASDLYLLLWNRRDRAGLDVEGDTAPLDAWRDKLRITWR